MKVDIYHIGPQKTATTWVYNCLIEHPDIILSKKDTVHYYDMFYHRGIEWYAQQFLECNPKKITIDPTTTYIRSPWAPKRIAKDNPDAKFIICLRNPIDRAFSHYWHEKKKNKIAFEFKEVLENYDLYSSWIEPGLYAEHIERYFRYFDKDQFLFLEFSLLKKNPRFFLTKILEFINVDSNFTPSLLNRKSNEATGRKNIFKEKWTQLKSNIVGSNLEKPLRRLNLDTLAHKIESAPMLGRIVDDKDEYEKGVPKNIKHDLLDLIQPEIIRLEQILGKSFDAWKK